MLITAPRATAHAGDDLEFIRPDVNGADHARAKAVEAQRLYRKKDFATALARLDEANALLPSPKLQYNFGLVHEALGHHPAALEAFGRFLAEVPDADPARRARAQRQVEALAPKLVALEVRSDTAGGEIIVDGVTRAWTPHARPIWVTPGPHQVVVKRAETALGYTERVDAPAGTALVIDARLADVPPPPAIAGAAPVATLADVRTTSVAPPSPWIRRSAYIAAAASGLALGMSLFAITQESANNDRFNEHNADRPPESHCNTALPNAGGGPCPTYLDRAKRWRSVKTGALITSGVLAVHAVTFFLLAPKTPAPQLAGGTPAIAFAPGEVTASWHLRF